MDDPVIVLVTADPQGHQAPRLEVENLALGPNPLDVVRRMPIAPGSSITQVVPEAGYIYQAMPIAPGPAAVGPARAADGSTFIEERHEVTIQAPPAIPFSDPARSIEILTRAGMVPAYVSCELSDTQAVVGQQVIARWYLISPLEDTYLLLPGKSPVPTSTPIAWYELLEEPNFSAKPVAIGSPIKKVLLRSIAIIPRRPGVLHVPDLDVSIKVPLEPIASIRDFGLPQQWYFRQVRRRSQSSELAVAPRSASIAAVGAGLSLSGVQRNDELVLTLSGDGDFRDTPAPKFATELDPAIRTDLRDQGARRKLHAIWTSHKWSYRISTTKSFARLPPLKLTVLDRGSLRDLDWQPELITFDLPPVPSHPARPPETHRLEALRDFGQIFGWVFLVAVGVWLVRTVNRVRQ